MTRSRPYRKNDNAHVEQRNWTHGRQHFSYERYDNPAVVPLINALCKGALGRLQHHLLPIHKLQKKVHRRGRVTRVYGRAQTPLGRVLAAPQVALQKKAELRALHARLNPFQLPRYMEWQNKQIEEIRLLGAGRQTGRESKTPAPKNGTEETGGRPPVGLFRSQRGAEPANTGFGRTRITRLSRSGQCLRQYFDSGSW